MVTDAFLLMRFSDVNLFIVRQGVTNKNIFGSIIKDVENRGVEASIIINGVELGKGYYGKRYGTYRYGYGYAYGYGYGHYGRYGQYGESGSGYYGDDANGDDKKKKHRHHHSSKDSSKE